jgi:cell wall-associated NlpC family hydrolase
MPNYRRVARRKARKYGINPRYFSRQIRQESGFNPHISSPAGAQGIAQIMPATARSWGVNPNHPRAALDAAARHMAQYLRAYHGSWSKALTAYNAGPGAVGGSLPAETRNYIATILRGGPDRQGVPRQHPGGGGSGPLFGFKPDRVKIGTKNVLDQRSFHQAQQAALVGQLIASHRGTDSPLFKSGLLSTTAPSAADFMSQRLTSKVIPGGGVKQVGGGGGGPVVGGSAVQRMLKTAEAWDRAKVSYLWGGGHGGIAKPGQRVDCSGYVSAILHSAGLLSAPRTSGQLESWGRPGRGKVVTVWASAGHVLIQIGHRWFATSHSNPGGGAGRIAPPARSYLGAFTPRHPRGL